MFTTQQTLPLYHFTTTNFTTTNFDKTDFTAHCLHRLIAVDEG
jgi:hypothetical protein